MTKYMLLKHIHPLHGTFLLKNISRKSCQRLNLRGSEITFSSCRPLSTQYQKWQQPTGYDTGILIYNPLVKEKVPLITKQEKILKWYSCGPTVYDSAHIGHASSYIRQDIVRRIIQKVFDVDCVLVMGMTDVDDKIIRKTKELQKPMEQVSSYYEAEFMRDMSRLNVMSPSMITRVMEHIPVITSFIEEIEKRGFAYRTSDGSVYFDVDKFSPIPLFYNPIHDNESLSVINAVNNSLKKNPKDFALWKASKPGEPKWDSPWGEGRPGWHIECSAMASAVLGSNFDLHSGGEDLMFPHHQNEHSQSCAFHQTNQWVNYWFHTGQLYLAGQTDKMSKSLKNTISVSEFLDTYTSNHLRMLCLLSSYRKRIAFSDDRVDKAIATVNTFNNFINKCDAYSQGLANTNSIPEAELYERLNMAKIAVRKAYADDFNTPQALANIMRLVRFASQVFEATDRKTQTSKVSAVRSPAVMCSLSSFVKQQLDLWGIEIAQKKNDKSLALRKQFDDVVDVAVASRNKIRDLAKDKKIFFETAAELDIPKEKAAILMKKTFGSLWNVSDEIRASLLKSGDVEIRDDKEGSTWVFVERKKTEKKLLNINKTVENKLFSSEKNDVNKKEVLKGV